MRGLEARPRGVNVGRGDAADQVLEIQLAVPGWLGHLGDRLRAGALVWRLGSKQVSTERYGACRLFSFAKRQNSSFFLG